MPGLLLGIVVGGSALIAALTTAIGPARLGALASAAAGCVTVGYLTVEIAMIGLGAWPQVVWFLVGLLMIGLSALLWRAESSSPGMSTTHLPV